MSLATKMFRTIHPARFLALLFASLLLCPSAIRAADPPVAYQHIQRSQPLLLQIHVLKIDLQAPGISLAVEALPDPDGDGPAETALALPLDHVRRGRLSAGVNANAWEMTPDPKTGEKPSYIAPAARATYSASSLATASSSVRRTPTGVSGWTPTGGLALDLARRPPSLFAWPFLVLGAWYETASP